MARANGNNADGPAQPRRNVRRIHGRRPELSESRAMPDSQSLARAEYQGKGGEEYWVLGVWECCRVLNSPKPPGAS